MKKLLTFLLLILLANCSSPPSHILPDPGCNSSGTVQSFTIENASRGYAYNFMIYLPPCYQTITEASYPVIYLIPGRGGGVNDWFNVKINNIADQLILEGQIPPFILVTTETTNSDPYATDIYTDLIPYIDNTFNTLSDRNHRSVAGGSLGGIAAYRLVFQHPDEFANAGMFGSGVVNGENDSVKIWLAETDKNDRPRVFINVGEQDPLMLDQAQEMIKILDQFNISYEFIVGEGDHSYTYWATNIEAYFHWVAQDW